MPQETPKLHEWKTKIAILGECCNGFVLRFSPVIIPSPHHFEENNNTSLLKKK